MRCTVGKGLDDYLKTLDNLALKSRTTVTDAIKAGAAKVLEAVRGEIQALPIEQGRTGTSEKPLTGVTSAQKKGLLDGLGASGEDDNNGMINRKIGFDGYNATRTKKYPKGQPNVVIARSLISGTSFRKKNDFMRRAVNKSRKAAEEAMRQAVDKGIAESLKRS